MFSKVLRRSTPLFAVILLATSMLFAAPPLAQASPDWSEPVNLSPGSPFFTDSWNPQIAVDAEGLCHVVWTAYNGADHIYYSTGAGDVWSEPVLISTTSLDNDSAQIAIDADGAAHVVWHGYDFDWEDEDVYYSTNAGGAWSTPDMLSPGSSDNYDPQIAMDSAGQAQVVWYGYDDGDEEDYVYWASGNAGGWSAPYLVSALSYDNFDPQIAVDSDGYPHVVWAGDDGDGEYETWYRTAAGGLWTNPEVLSTDSWDNWAPQIALDSGDEAQVVWAGTDDDDDEDYIYYSTGTAGSWSSPDMLSTSSYYNDNPQIALDSYDCPNVVWSGEDGDDEEYYIYYSRWGEGWSAPRVLSTNSYDNEEPQIALSPFDVSHVVWSGYYDEDDEEHVFYASDADGWTDPPPVLSTTSAWNYEPQIALDQDGDAHVVWEGEDEAETRGIYYATGYFNDWSEPVLVSDTIKEGSIDNWDPQVAVDADGVAHAVWSGNDGTGDWIYYANNAGGAWSEPEAIPNAIPWNYQPRMALDSGGEPHVVWFGFDSDWFELNVYYSAHTGAGWTAPDELKGGSWWNLLPQIALDSGDGAHVVWTGFGIEESYVYYATNAGGAWSAPLDLSSDTDWNGIPQIALDSDDAAHVVWEGQSEEYTQAWYSTNAGGAWSDPDVLSINTDAGYQPQVAVDGSGAAHAVWQGYDETLDREYTCYSTGTAGSWSAPYEFPSSHWYNQDSRIAVDEEGLCHVVWCGLDEGGLDSQIYYSRGGGNSWSAPVVRSVYGENRDPQVALDPAGNPHVAWRGNDASSVEGIWYATSTGGQWSAPLVVSTDSIENMYPQIALGPDGYPHAVWMGMDGDLIYRVWYGRDFAPAPTDYTWYLPEGCTDGGMETWILLENPGPADVTVDLEFDTDKGAAAPPGLAGLTVPAESRISCDVTPFVTTYDLATRVISHGGPVNCERATYGNNRAWGTTSTGFFGTANQWCMAEGSTDGGMVTWILVQNPNDEAVDVDMKFLTGSGEVQGPQATLTPHTRTTCRVNDWVTTYDVACEVTASGTGVICERAMYGGDQGAGWVWGTCSNATPLASAQWYLPGLHTANSAWLLIANPNDTAAAIDVKYYTGSAEVQGPQGNVPARSRATFNAADTVPGAYVSAVVTASGAEVVCDWAEYSSDWSWGVSSLAAPFLATDIWLTEGSTDGGMNTFITVFNPGDTAVTADLTLYTGSGEVALPALQGLAVPAQGVLTVLLNDHLTDYNVTTRVTATGPVTAKRMTSGPDAGWCTATGNFTP